MKLQSAEFKNTKNTKSFPVPIFGIISWHKIINHSNWREEWWKKIDWSGIRTHAPEEIGALIQRLRPLGHPVLLSCLKCHNMKLFFSFSINEKFKKSMKKKKLNWMIKNESVSRARKIWSKNICTMNPRRAYRNTALCFYPPIWCHYVIFQYHKFIRGFMDLFAVIFWVLICTLKCTLGCTLACGAVS